MQSRSSTIESYGGYIFAIPMVIYQELSEDQDPIDNYSQNFIALATCM